MHDMNFVYTNHAEENLFERKISKLLVEFAVKNSDLVSESMSGRKIAHKLINNKLLRVVYSKYNSTYVIITAYYTKPKRYKVDK